MNAIPSNSVHALSPTLDPLSPTLEHREETAIARVWGVALGDTPSVEQALDEIAQTVLGFGIGHGLISWEERLNQCLSPSPL